MLARLEGKRPDLRLQPDGKTAPLAGAAKPKCWALKTSLLFLAGRLMVAPGLCPQVAADGATNTLSNRSNCFTAVGQATLSPVRHLNRIAQVGKTNASTF